MQEAVSAAAAVSIPSSGAGTRTGGRGGGDWGGGGEKRRVKSAPDGWGAKIAAEADADDTYASWGGGTIDRR